MTSIPPTPDPHSTPTALAAAVDDAGPWDVVGLRVLVGVQMVNISRLSTHPVPVTTSGLITVAGQGPTDSNGAGKSSFIAGLSLLHADDQWRLQSGAQAAAELLFTAELAGQEAQHANADRGYIVGVFAPPRAITAEELDAGVLTVWLRINRQSPHLELRWAHRLHVLTGGTEHERAAGADAAWGQLPRSNGRTDLRANRLARTLYGDTVRCVSFLSTSVRASPTANLLAQPLNELSPERIFDAIGALTGLTGELEQEQKARSVEHAHALAAERAGEQYADWDRRMAAVEEGIRARQRAQLLLEQARAGWRGRCARQLVDAVARAGEIAEDLRVNERERAELAASVEQAQQELDLLTDDRAFDRGHRERVTAYTSVKSEVDALEKEHSQRVGQLETMLRTRRELLERAQGADGLGVEQAAGQRRAAEAALAAAQRAKGAAEAELRAARRALAAAERGDDVATEQLLALRAAGIEAAPLVELVEPAPRQLAVWQPRLLPYRGAVVVAHADAAAAASALAGVPDCLVVLADPPGPARGGAAATGANGAGTSGTGTPGADPSGVGTPGVGVAGTGASGVGAAGADSGPAGGPGPDLPPVLTGPFTLDTFLTALAERAGAGPTEIDAAAGVLVAGGSTEPLTGRAGRIGRARAGAGAAQEADAAAEAAVAAADRDLRRVRAREAAARAAAEAAGLDQLIGQLREENEANQSTRDALAPRLERALAGYQQALADKAARDTRIAAVRERIKAAERDQSSTLDRWHELTTRREELDLDGHHERWGGTVDTAHRHLAGLDEHAQRLAPAEWDDLADELSEQARRACFPTGTPAEQLPEELRLVDEQRGGRRTADRLRLLPAVLRVLGTYLDQHATVDRQQQAEIEVQRAEKVRTLRSAADALAEARRASTALRAILATAIKAKLRQVSAEFDRIDKAYGGYGGTLDHPEPEPPADPDKPWRWAVTPKWRRSEGKSPASYRLRGNTAQMDDKAVKLVCAAALAGSGERPLLLVLDELGRNLGAAHRRDAVALFENIGRDRAISVVGALQDDMERYAVGASSLYIKLRRTSDTTPYNQAPVVIGNDGNEARVRLLADWLSSYRPG